MSDVARVRAAFDAGTLMHPVAADVPSTVDLACAVASWCGAPSRPSAHAASLQRRLGDSQHLVLVLVDGLGMELLDTLAASAFLRRAERIELRAVHPSSTAPALTSLTTACWPGEHAVPGWWTYLPVPGITATILPFIERFSQEPAGRHGATPAEAWPSPSFLRDATADVLVLQPEYISGSVYSTYFAGARPQTGYRHLAEAADVIADRVRASSGPTFTYLYIPFVDATAHERGPWSRETRDVVTLTDGRLGKLAERLTGRARMAVTADHGNIELRDPGLRTALTRDDPLLPLLRFPFTCEPRAPAFHVMEGAEEQFEQAFRARFGDAWALLTADETADLRLLGPEAPTAETLARIGTYQAVSVEPRALLYEPAPELAAMVGFHGGLTPGEMRIPLLLA